MGWASVPFMSSHPGRRTRRGHGASTTSNARAPAWEGEAGVRGRIGGRAVEGKGSEAKGWLGFQLCSHQLQPQPQFLPLKNGLILLSAGSCWGT